MLVLSRRKDESVMIGDNIEVKVLDIQKGQVKLGIEASRDVTLRRDESVMVGDDLEVKVLDIQKGQVKLGIEAPRDVTIHRMEVYLAIKEENPAATQTPDAAADVSALAGLFEGADKPSKAGPAQAKLAATRTPTPQKGAETESKPD